MSGTQNIHPALALLAARPALFARQGHVAMSWRRSGQRMLGPYYKLRYREAGRARTIYLGREGPLVDEVRRALAALQAPWRRRRALAQATRQVHAAMRRGKAGLDAQLRTIGLRMQGFEVRGWRGRPS